MNNNKGGKEKVKKNEGTLSLFSTIFLHVWKLSIITDSYFLGGSVFKYVVLFFL